MNRKITFVLFFALLLIGCGGEGEAVEGQEFWQAIVAHLLEIVVVIATPLILVLVSKLVKVIEAKANIDVAERHEVMLDEWITKGIAFGHEQGRKALKEGKDPVSGDEKKNAAVDFIAEGLKNTGLAEMGAEALAKLVESKLNVERTPEDTESPADPESDDEEE
jgi:hypothetical protein